MSVADGISQQSSRMYFKGRDHKDCYGTLPDQYNNMQYNKFHRGMYMRGKDPDRYDLIWRKQYPDRYFIYRTEGPVDWGGRHWLCYPKPKIIAGDIGLHISVSDGTYWYGRANQWADSIGEWSEDCRLQRGINTSLSYSRGAGLHSIKGGIIERDWDYNWHFLEFADDRYKIFSNFVDEITIGPQGIIPDSNYPQVMTDPFGRSPLFYWWDNKSATSTIPYYTLLYRIFDSRTKNLSPVYSYKHYGKFFSASTTHYVKGRFFMTYSIMPSEDNYRCGLLEFNGSSVIREVLLPGSWTWFGGMGPIKYYNGRYYIYTTGNVKSGNTSIKRMRVFSTTNFSSFTQHDVPDSIEIPHFGDYEYTYTLHLVGDDWGRHEGGYQGLTVPFFEKNKLIEDYPDLVCGGSIYTPWTNPVRCYFDNPLFVKNDATFYVYSSDGMSDFGMDGQDMARRYYHMEV